MCTRFIQSGTERSNMDKATLQRRILLCLFGMGTNTGIKSMESLPGDDYKDLLYIRRRFISNEGLRQAITQVVNATWRSDFKGSGVRLLQPVQQTLSNLGLGIRIS